VYTDLGLAVHIIWRSHGRRGIFFQESRRHCVATLLLETTGALGGELLCFCIMPDHIHLVVTLGELAVAESVKRMKAKLTMSLRGKVEGRIW
jgi:REP element-mobilizing transposase RayT